MEINKEIKTKNYVNNTSVDDGYFDVPDGYWEKSSDGYKVNHTKTSSLLSTNVIIKSNGYAVGAIQRFDFWEHTDGDSVLVNGQCSRIFFDRVNILEAFTGQPHIAPIKKFDIEIYYQYPEESMIMDKDGKMQFTGPGIILSGVEITNRHTYFDVEKFVVVEDMCFTAEKIAAIERKIKK